MSLKAAKTLDLRLVTSQMGLARASRRSPFGSVTLAALSLYAILCVLLFAISAARTGGRYVYPLDDTYIHLAIAKNLAHSGVHGVTPHEYSSSSSSPLWGLLIALGLRFTGSELVPLFCSFTAGALLLIVCGHLLRRSGVSPGVRGVALGSMVLVTPLPTLTMSGMEHIFHAALSCGIVFAGAGILAGDASRGLARRLWWTCGLIAIAVPIRFETLLIALLLAVFLALRGRLPAASAVAASAAAPVLVTGAIAVSRGWFWLPASVLLKASKAPAQSIRDVTDRLGGRALDQLYAAPPLLVLFGLVLVMFYLLQRSAPARLRRADWMLILTGAAVLGHLQFGAVGWLFRYEAYLIVLSLFTLAYGTREWPEHLFRKASPARNVVPALSLVACLLVCAHPLLMRASTSLLTAPRASFNIYQQQIQMARFIKQYYDGSSIAANDIGAINFYSELSCLDLAGLANLRVARALLQGTYGTQTIAEEAERRGTRIAILYDNWFNGGNYPRPPESWMKVGEWTVDHNTILGGSTVSFYAVQPSECATLSGHLFEYAPRLPRGVTGAYRGCGRLYPDTQPASPHPLMSSR